MDVLLSGNFRMEEEAWGLEHAIDVLPTDRGTLWRDSNAESESMVRGA